MLIFIIISYAFLGLLLYKIGKKHMRLAYFIGILPYSILFWLTWEDSNYWGPYRAMAAIGTIVAAIVWGIARYSEKMKSKLE